MKLHVLQGSKKGSMNEAFFRYQNCPQPTNYQYPNLPVTNSQLLSPLQYNQPQRCTPDPYGNDLNAMSPLQFNQPWRPTPNPYKPWNPCATLNPLQYNQPMGYAMGLTTAEAQASCDSMIANCNSLLTRKGKCRSKCKRCKKKANKACQDMMRTATGTVQRPGSDPSAVWGGAADFVSSSAPAFASLFMPPGVTIPGQTPNKSGGGMNMENLLLPGVIILGLFALSR